MSFRQKANNIILTAFSVIFIAFSLRPAGLPYRYGHIVPHLPLPRITEKMISSVNVAGKELDAAQISEFVRLYNRSKVKGALHNTMLSPSTYIRFSDGSEFEISQQYGTTLGISFTDKSRNGGYSEYIIVNLELTSFLYCIRGTTLSDMYC
ncbi:unknown [Candidatus Colimorpha enterica]|uniref:Uncharacterized protein n=1 Tax=Candidatus Colimorpha enterica TaxID=3083063 RepID=R6U3S0_9BACT|nr:unknown [Candidatus Colimorpha enterica]